MEVGISRLAAFHLALCSAAAARSPPSCSVVGPALAPASRRARMHQGAPIVEGTRARGARAGAPAARICCLPASSGDGDGSSSAACFTRPAAPCRPQPAPTSALNTQRRAHRLAPAPGRRQLRHALGGALARRVQAGAGQRLARRVQARAWSRVRRHESAGTRRRSCCFFCFFFCIMKIIIIIRTIPTGCNNTQLGIIIP